MQEGEDFVSVRSHHGGQPALVTKAAIRCLLIISYATQAPLKVPVTLSRLLLPLLPGLLSVSLSHVPALRWPFVLSLSQSPNKPLKLTLLCVACSLRGTPWWGLPQVPTSLHFVLSDPTIQGNLFGHLKNERGGGKNRVEMAQWLAALVALPEDVVQIPAPMPGSLQLPLTPASGDLMVSFGLADFKREWGSGAKEKPLGFHHNKSGL